MHEIAHYMILKYQDNKTIGDICFFGISADKKNGGWVYYNPPYSKNPLHKYLDLNFTKDG